jgi:hypothetical protein
MIILLVVKCGAEAIWRESYNAGVESAEAVVFAE